MAPKIKQSPKRPAEERRRQLIETARLLFLKKGYRGTNVDEIAHKTKLTKGAFYHHFDSKEDILLAMFKEMSSMYQRAVEQVIRPGCKPVDYLKALLAMHRAGSMAEFRNMVDIWVQGSRIPRIYRYLERHQQERLNRFAENLDRSYGRTKKERLDLAVFTFSFFEGLTMRKSRWPDVVDLDAQLRLFSQLIESRRRTARKTSRS